MTMETEKLIAALRCDESLGSQACKKCPYAADKKNMCLTIDLDAADALERLTAKNAEKDAEIERLKEQIAADSQLKSGLDNANALRRTYKGDRDRLQAELLSKANSAPIVDAVPVVRCRECKRKEACICVVCEDGDMIFCAALHRHMNPDDFCSYGERKEDD